MAKTQKQTIEDGHSAHRLTNDTDLTRFMDEIEAEAFTLWKTSKDVEGREAAYQRVHGVNLLRQKLKSLVDNATIAQKQIL